MFNRVNPLSKLIPVLLNKLHPKKNFQVRSRQNLIQSKNDPRNAVAYVKVKLSNSARQKKSDSPMSAFYCWPCPLSKPSEANLRLSARRREHCVISQVRDFSPNVDTDGFGKR